MWPIISLDALMGTGMAPTDQQYAQEVGVVPPDLDELLRSMGMEPPQR